jgi:hypothetical protein
MCDLSPVATIGATRVGKAPVVPTFATGTRFAHLLVTLRWFLDSTQRL